VGLGQLRVELERLVERREGFARAVELQQRLPQFEVCGGVARV
jgi:hypothetical protein